MSNIKRKLKLNWTKEMLDDVKKMEGFGEDYEEKLANFLGNTKYLTKHFEENNQKNEK